MEAQQLTPEKEKPGIFQNAMMNPLVRKLNKVTDRDDAHSATYGGIVGKTLFFVLMTIAGIGVYFVLRTMFLPTATMGFNQVMFSTAELVGAGIALLFTILCPILIWVAKPLVPVLGSLYCLSQGFTVAMLCTVSGPEYQWLAGLSLALTMLIVLVMLILYVAQIVKVTAKFRSVVSTLFFTSLIGGLLFFICSFIPGLSTVVQFIQENSVLSIVGAALFVVIASLFLLVDFDCIKHTVEDQLPKKYEWFASMALVFTIIWLYFKVLELVLRVTGAGQNK